MRNFRTYGLCAVAATALLMAGCGGGGGTRPATAAAAPTPTPTPTPPVAPANAVDLQGQTAEADAMLEIPAGMTMKSGGVRFSCSGDTDCTVTVAADGMSATADAGMVTAAMLDATGNQAFMNLAVALLDAEQRDDLRANLYQDTADVVADANQDPVVVAVDNGGGVTTSLTTHNEPGSIGDADELTGVSDIFVSVTPSVMRAMDSDASKTVLILDADANDDENGPEADPEGGFNNDSDPWEIANPVLVGEDGEVTTERTSNFAANAAWDLNPAAEWTIDPALMGATQNMDDDEDDIWTHYFQATQDLAGGRTLQLDLRSDHDPNNTMLGMGMNIARGPASAADGPDQVRVDWEQITGLSAPPGGEVNLAVDDGDDSNGAEGVPGTYMGVKGVFSCVDGTGAEDGNNICRINHHENGMLSVSEDDTVMFRPYTYTPDTDWLAAGVWLTIPDDTEDGDYAIGAFVFGNDPYKGLASDFQELTGTATYSGQAFGRYAEADGDNTETGRFTANAVLTADFGVVDTMGSINGDLTGFVANGQSEDWDVNFEEAMISVEMEDHDSDPATPMQAVTGVSTLRFNGGASGHARGHGMTGYWNGQFYGNPATGATGDDLQPGSAAGTFGLTTERDNEDNYSLTMGGAFATHRDE